MQGRELPSCCAFAMAAELRRTCGRGTRDSRGHVIRVPEHISEITGTMCGRALRAPRNLVNEGPYGRTGKG